MGRVVLLFVVIAIGALGWFIGKIMPGRAATTTGIVCLCAALATCSYAETRHEWGALVPLAWSCALILLGLGFFVAAMTGTNPGGPQNAPLSANDIQAAERIAARMKRLRALEQSVPDYSQIHSNQTHSPKEPDPPQGI
jgi:hypothetical protein